MMNIQKTATINPRNRSEGRGLAAVSWASTT
jgi:hypothetical protein